MTEITPGSRRTLTPFAAADDGFRLEMLNAQLRRARYASRFYAAYLPERLGSLRELEALPFTTAEDIKASGTAMVCVPAQDIARIVTLRTSGTQGAPKRLYFTRNDLERTVSFFAEGMAWMCRRGDGVGIFMPCASPDGIGDLLARGLEKIGTRPLRYGMVGSVSELLPRLKEERPQVLVGLPWQMRLLALAMPELRPRVVLLSADCVPDGMYELLREIWDCETLSHYGMTETGLGGAVEGFDHSGLFLRRDELYAEVVDPKTGLNLPDGEIGEIVLTTLRREAMPLFRYRTGDLGALAADGSGNFARVLCRNLPAGDEPPPALLMELDRLLCPKRQILDYSVSWKSDGGLLTLSLQASGSLEDCKAAIFSAAEGLFPRFGRLRLSVNAELVPPEKAHSAYPAKRSILV